MRKMDKKCKIMLCIGILGFAVAIGGKIENHRMVKKYEDRINQSVDIEIT
ncbi:hypothetical protein LCGC14_2489600 [marine sediment metagenome]|uniref:Uncharacterized protein n=1 Tax=marine sediment metagenome TaxID=412755 RepID=A0A0F9DH03_9ZZZZ